jgi:hypothetical protein
MRDEMSVKSGRDTDGGERGSELWWTATSTKLHLSEALVEDNIHLLTGTHNVAAKMGSP